MGNHKTLILGLGNILLNDEGIGIHAVNQMIKMDWPEGVDLLDGGTGGFSLLSVFQTYDTIIIIDAALSDDSSKMPKILEPKFSKDFPPSLSAHNLGLKDMIESAILMGHLPKIYLVAVPINSRQNMEMELSEELKQMIPKIIEMAKGILTKHLGLTSY